MNESLRSVLRTHLLEEEVFWDSWEIERVLKQAGWKTHKKEERYWQKNQGKHSRYKVLVKGFSGVRIRALIYDSLVSSLLKVDVGPTTSESLRIKDDTFEKDDGSLRKSIEVDRRRGFKVTDVERAAKEVAKEVKKVRKPRVKKEYQFCHYQGKEGKEAVDLWMEDVEEIIVKELKGSKQYFDDLWKQAWSTASITNNILNNYGRDCGLGKRASHAKIVNILKKLARKKLVDELPPRETGERETLWVWEGPI